MTAEQPHPAGGQTPPPVYDWSKCRTDPKCAEAPIAYDSHRCEPTPNPPEGFASWLDYIVASNDVWLHPKVYSNGRAELAVLRKERDEAREEREKYRYSAQQFCGGHVGNWFATCPACERDEARAKLADTEGLLATARENLVTIDAQRAEAVRERDEAIAKLPRLKRIFDEAVRLGREVNQEGFAIWQELAQVKNQRDEARAKLAELREAALKLGKLTGVVTVTQVVDWNALVAKLRAEQGGEEGK